MRHFLSTKPWWTIGSLGACKPETGARQVRTQAADSTPKYETAELHGWVWPRTACCCNPGDLPRVLSLHWRTSSLQTCCPACVQKTKHKFAQFSLCKGFWPAVGTQERLTLFFFPFPPPMAHHCCSPSLGTSQRALFAQTILPFPKDSTATVRTLRWVSKGGHLKELGGAARVSPIT